MHCKQRQHMTTEPKTLPAELIFELVSVLPQQNNYTCILNASAILRHFLLPFIIKWNCAVLLEYATLISNFNQIMDEKEKENKTVATLLEELCLSSSAFADFFSHIRRGAQSDRATFVKAIKLYENVTGDTIAVTGLKMIGSISQQLREFNTSFTGLTIRFLARDLTQEMEAGTSQQEHTYEEIEEEPIYGEDGYLKPRTKKVEPHDDDHKKLRDVDSKQSGSGSLLQMITHMTKEIGTSTLKKFRPKREMDLQMLEQQMGALFKLRVDVNDLDPEQIVVRCNKETEGPVTFFVHPIEGIASPLNRVMSKCRFPAYCFQFTRQVPNDSIESVANTYIKEMKKIQSEGPYRLIGYSYGACIGFEMATQLQRSDGNDSVEKLILLDGSHLYLKMAFGVTGDTLVNNPLFETEIMCAMTLRFADVDYKRFRMEMLQLPSFKERLQRVVDTVMGTGLFQRSDTIAFAVDAMRHKFVMADKYKPKASFKGHITLVRAQQGAAWEEDVGKDYGIGQVAESITVHLVNGDHDSIVQGKKHIDTAAIINAVLLNESIPEKIKTIV